MVALSSNFEQGVRSGQRRNTDFVAPKVPSASWNDRKSDSEIGAGLHVKIKIISENNTPTAMPPVTHRRARPAPGRL
jgi:hypothetical protein